MQNTPNQASQQQQAPLTNAQHQQFLHPSSASNQVPGLFAPNQLSNANQQMMFNSQQQPQGLNLQNAMSNSQQQMVFNSQVPQQPQNNAFDDLLSNPTNITQ